MNKKLITALSVVCLTLLLIIMLEWLYATRVQKQLLSSINSETKQASLDEMPSIDLNAQPEESYIDLVDRPLFIKDRKPVEQSAQIAVTTVTGTFDWLLSGVYTSKKGLMALLTRSTATTPPIPATAKTPTNKKYRKVILNEDIDGWKVTNIYHDKIVLTQGMTEKTLLLRKTKIRSETNENKNITPIMPESIPKPQAGSKPVTEPQVEPEPEPELQAEPINDATDQ